MFHSAMREPHRSSTKLFIFNEMTMVGHSCPQAAFPAAQRYGKKFPDFAISRSDLSLLGIFRSLRCNAHRPQTDEGSGKKLGILQRNSSANLQESAFTYRNTLSIKELRGRTIGSINAPKEVVIGTTNELSPNFFGIQPTALSGDSLHPRGCCSAQTPLDNGSVSCDFLIQAGAAHPARPFAPSRSALKLACNQLLLHCQGTSTWRGAYGAREMPRLAPGCPLKSPAK